MKSLVRLNALPKQLAIVAAGVLLTAGQALALPQEKILEKLNFIPVFTIADAQGAPLVAQPPEGQKGNPTAGVFISQKDAQGFLENLRKRSPDVAKTVKVVTVSMAEIYQLQQKAVEKKNPLVFAFVPTRQQMDAALTVLKANGQKDATRYEGTPMFVARAGKEKGFLTVPQNGKSVIPFFFNQEQLQPLLDDFKKQQPTLANTVDIQVFPLEGVLDALQKQQDPGLEQVVLVPSTESLQLLQEGAKAAAAGKKK